MAFCIKPDYVFSRRDVLKLENLENTWIETSALIVSVFIKLHVTHLKIFLVNLRIY